MVIKVCCPQCESTYSVDESWAGRTARCRKCGATIQIPDDSIPPSLTNDALPLRVEQEPEATPVCQVTSTDSLQGWTITDYLGLVTAHCVEGTGFLTDFAASFTDFFGGRSLTYQRKMAAIEEEAINALRAGAIAKGANWVIGTRIDFDEISGKGMQMFMVSAQGTAVHAIRTPISRDADSATALRVTGTAVWDQIRKDRILRRLSDLESRPVFGTDAVTEDMMVALCELRIAEAVPLCLRLALAPDQVSGPRTKQLAMQALRVAPRHATRDALHGMLLQNPQIEGVVGLYRELGLLDLRWVLRQVESLNKSNREVGLQALCRGVATAYSKQDIPVLHKLRTVIPRTFPETAQEVEVSVLLKGREKKWRCGNGHDSPIDAPRCFTCDIDRHGITRHDASVTIAAQIIDSTLAVLESHFRT